MGQFKVFPVEMISAPNYYSFLKDIQWQLTHNIASSLTGQMWLTDALGSRRYIIPTGASLQVTFLRADTQAVLSVSQTVQKIVTINAQDRSLFSFNLSAAESQQVISGSVIFKLTDPGVGALNGEWTQNYGVKKILNGPGY